MRNRRRRKRKGMGSRIGIEERMIFHRFTAFDLSSVLNNIASPSKLFSIRMSACEPDTLKMINHFHSRQIFLSVSIRIELIIRAYLLKTTLTTCAKTPMFTQETVVTTTTKTYEDADKQSKITQPVHPRVNASDTHKKIMTGNTKPAEDIRRQTLTNSSSSMLDNSEHTTSWLTCIF